MIAYLLEGQAPDRDRLARIRFCRSASAALPPEHHRAFEAKFGIDIVETMGLTETVAPAFSNPIERELRKIGSVGRASGCEARVVDGIGHEEDLLLGDAVLHVVAAVERADREEGVDQPVEHAEEGALGDALGQVARGGDRRRLVAQQHLDAAPARREHRREVRPVSVAVHPQRIEAAGGQPAREAARQGMPEIERLELAEAATEMRHAVTRFSWLKVFVPGLSTGKFSQSAKNLNASLGQLVNQYPMLSSLASLVLAKPVRSLLRASAGPALKWGTVGFAAWEIYRIWKQSRDERGSAANDD